MNNLIYVLVSIAIASLVVAGVILSTTSSSRHNIVVENESNKIMSENAGSIFEKIPNVTVSSQSNTILVNNGLVPVSIVLKTNTLEKVILHIKPAGSLVFVKTDKYTTDYTKEVIVNGEKVIQLEYKFNPNVAFFENYTITVDIVAPKTIYNASSITLKVRFDPSFVLGMTPRAGTVKVVNILNQSYAGVLKKTLEVASPSDMSVYAYFVQYLENRFGQKIRLHITDSIIPNDTLHVKFAKDTTLYLLNLNNYTVKSFPLYDLNITLTMSPYTRYFIYAVTNYTGNFVSVTAPFKYSIINENGQVIGTARETYTMFSSTPEFIMINKFEIFTPVGRLNKGESILDHILGSNYIVSVGSSLNDLTPVPDNIDSAFTTYNVFVSPIYIVGTNNYGILFIPEGKPTPLAGLVFKYRDYLNPSKKKYTILREIIVLNDNYNWFNLIKVDKAGHFVVDETAHALPTTFSLVVPNNVKSISIEKSSVHVTLMSYNSTFFSFGGFVDLFNYPINGKTKHKVYVIGKGHFLGGGWGELYFSCHDDSVATFSDPTPDTDRDSIAVVGFGTLDSFHKYFTIKVSGIDFSADYLNIIDNYLEHPEYYLKNTYEIVDYSLLVKLYYNDGHTGEQFVWLEIAVPLGNPDSVGSIMNIAKNFEKDTTIYSNCVQELDGESNSYELVCIPQLNQNYGP